MPDADAEVPSSPGPILPLERLGAVVEIVICSGFPTQVFLVFLLRGFGMRMMIGDAHLSPPFVFTLSLADAVLVIALVLFFLRAHRERIGDALLGPRRVVREALVGVAILPAVFILVVLILGIIVVKAPWLRNVPNNPLEDMLRSRSDALIFAAVVMIAGGLREEVQRGFVLHRFDRYLGGGWLGLPIYSVLFGLGHYEQGYDAMIATTLLGAIWGLVYLIRRSIVAPMVCHAGFNLAQLAKYMVMH